MKWITHAQEYYQQTEQGTTRGRAYYYVYRESAGKWKAGRYTFNQDVDFRMEFSSAKAARDYLEIYDREAVIIEEIDTDADAKFLRKHADCMPSV